MRNSWRIFAIGGLLSFRALFRWMTPWIYIPSLIVAPVLQIILFAYLGRSAGVGNDQFYIIGNAIQYSAIPCLFAMGQTVSGERRTQTLGLVLTSPAPRIPLFLGRAMPVVVNGWVSSVVALVLGGLVLGVPFSPGVLAKIALMVAVASFSCTGLGLMLAGVDLRVREGSTMNNIVFGFLLIFTGANVALSALPAWMVAFGRILPLTHAIEASRQLANGSSLGAVSGPLGAELVIGAVYIVAGLTLLLWFEQLSRRRATLELM